MIYRSKMHMGPKRHFQLMPGAQWLELLLRHVPDRYDHPSPWSARTESEDGIARAEPVSAAIGRSTGAGVRERIGIEYIIRLYALEIQAPSDIT